jgi:hypothetical protein
MAQEVIAYLIIVFAFGLLGLNILRFFNIIKKNDSSSAQCKHCSTRCELKDVQKINKRGKYNQYRFYL